MLPPVLSVPGMQLSGLPLKGHWLPAIYWCLEHHTKVASHASVAYHFCCMSLFMHPCSFDDPSRHVRQPKMKPTPLLNAPAAESWPSCTCRSTAPWQVTTWRVASGLARLSWCVCPPPCPSLQLPPQSPWTRQQWPRPRALMPDAGAQTHECGLLLQQRCMLYRKPTKGCIHEKLASCLNEHIALVVSVHLFHV